MATPVQLQKLSLDDYVRLFEGGEPFEIINGERKSLMPPVVLHNLTIRTLFLILYQFCQPRGLGEVFSEMPFVLVDESNWVKGSRIPDLMFIRAERWQHYTKNTENWQNKPLVIVPDLVVEVVSQHDLYTDLQDKVRHYLQDGVTTVWVLDPNRQQADVYTGTQYQHLDIEQTLTAETVLPNLKIQLKAVFPKPE